MPCDILYNGKRYTLAEFVKLLSENELFNKINDNTITGSLADGYRKSFAAEFASPEADMGVEKMEEQTELYKTRLRHGKLSIENSEKATKLSKKPNGDVDFEKFQQELKRLNDETGVTEMGIKIKEMESMLPKLDKEKYPSSGELQDKSGNKYPISIKIDESQRKIMISDQSGKMSLSLFLDSDGKFYPNMIYTDPSLRRKGIASSMIDFAKNMGLDIKRSTEETKDGVSFFSNIQFQPSPQKQAIAEATPSVASPETQIKKEYDTENKPRVGGEVGVGEKPVETESKPGAGREAAPTGRDVQGDVTAKEEKLGRQVSETKGKIKPLEGAPSTPGASGPDPNLVFVAEKYAKENGIDYKRQGEYVKVDEERAKRIADAYEKMKHDPKDPKVKKAYRDLIEQTKKQYQALVDAGYEFTFFDSKTDPYDGNPSNAMRDLRNNKKMAVYGTYDGYGTEGITGAEIENNPMLEDTGIVWKDQNGVSHAVLANDLFRAVHDAFGHGLEGAGFRARGEENAWQAHVRLFVGDAVAAITTETRGQNSWLNYGPYGEKNRTAKLEDTVFAEQKTGLMPEWTWNEGLAKDFEQEPVTEMPFQDQVKSDMESGEYSLYVDGESAGVKNFDDAMDLIERMDLQDGEVLYIKDATGKSFATIDNKGNINPYESSSLDYDTQKSEIAEKYGEDNQVLKALENASKALKKNSPDAKIYIHDNSESLANAVSQVTGKDTSAYATDNGHIVMDKDGNVVEVHFAMDGANKVTVYHEIIHPILTSAIGNDVNVMKEMVNAAKSILSEADIKSLEQFIKQYDGDLTKADEFLTELGARITANTVKFKDKAWLDKVKSFINDISKKYAGVTVFEKTDNENIVRDFFRTMSEGLTSSKVDKETLSKKIEEFRLKKTILNPDVAPDVEPGNQIGGSADGLNKSSRDLEKARVKWFNTTPKGDKGDVKMVYPDPVAIEEVFEKSGGAVVFVNSDATKVGTVEINGRKFKLYGGFDYTFIEQNVKDGIGFAASADNKIENLKTIATAIANKRDKLNPQHKGKPVAVFVVSHNGEAMLGEWYASEYIMEGLDVSLSKKKYPGGLRAAKKNFRDAINNVEISTKKEENKKEAALRDKLLGMIDSGEFDTHEGRMRIAKFLAGKDVSFAFRVKLNGSIMPNQGNKKASKKEKNRELRDALSKAGHFLNDFWQKFADERFMPRLNETRLQDEKNKVFGGMSFSGFYYDPKTSLEKQVEHSKGGIEHQQFNSSFKSEGNFLLNSAYNVNQLFPDAGFPFESAYQLYNKEHGTNFVKKTTEVADKMAITEWLLKNGKSNLISPPATMASQSIYSGVADANMKPVLNEYVEAVDTPKPVKKPVISKASKGQKTALPGKNLVPKSYDIDTDKEGNYLFYHYGNIEGNKIDPKNWGKNAYTSDKRFHGVSYYYTKGNQKEMVVGGDPHVVAVPKYQVYPFNKDPLNFYDQAEKNFRKEFPNGAFDAVRQIDFMNPLIAKAGFKMVVAEWGEFPLRAETTLPLSYDKKKTEQFRKFGGFEGSLRKEKYAQDILNELSEKANTSKGVASGLNEAFYDAGGLNADVDKLLSNPKIKAQVSKKAISNYEGETKAQKKEEGKGSKLKAAAEQAAKEAEMEAAEPSVPSPEEKIKPVKEILEEETGAGRIREKAIESRVVEAGTAKPEVIKGLIDEGIEYEQQSQDKSRKVAEKVVKAYKSEFGNDWRVKLENDLDAGAFSGRKLGAIPAYLYDSLITGAESIDKIRLINKLSNSLRDMGQFISAMRDIQLKSPEGLYAFVVEKQRRDIEQALGGKGKGKAVDPKSKAGRIKEAQKQMAKAKKDAITEAAEKVTGQKISGKPSLTHEKRRERGKKKVDEALEGLKQWLTNPKISAKIDLNDAYENQKEFNGLIFKLADGLFDQGVANAAELITKMKEALSKLGIDEDSFDTIKDRFLEDFNFDQKFMDQKRDEGSEKLAKKIVNLVNQPKSKKFDPVKQMMDTLFAKVKETVTVPNKPKATAEEKIQEALRNFYEYESVFYKSRLEVIDMIDALDVSDAEKRAMKDKLETYMTEEMNVPYGKKTASEYVKQKMKEKAVDVKSVLLKSNDIQASTREQFVNEIVDRLRYEAGLTASEASKVAEEFYRQYDKIFEEKKKQALKQTLGGDVKAKIKGKREHEKITNAIKFGAFDGNKIKVKDEKGNVTEVDSIYLFAEKFGIPDANRPDVQEILKAYTEAISKLPANSVQRRMVEKDLNMFLSYLKGEHKGFWQNIFGNQYAMILFDYGTWTNVINGNMTMSLFVLGVKAARKATFEIGRIRDLGVMGNALWNGMHKSLRSAKGVLVDNTLREGSDVASSTIAEIRAKYQKNPIAKKYFEFVALSGKILNALDAFVTVAMSDFYYADYVLDRLNAENKKLDKSQRLSNSEIRQYAKDLIGLTPTIRQRAEAQATEEFKEQYGENFEMKGRTAVLWNQRVDELQREFGEEKLGADGTPDWVSFASEDLQRLYEQAVESGGKIGLVGKPAGTLGVISHHIEMVARNVLGGELLLKFVNAGFNSAAFVLKSTPVSIVPVIKHYYTGKRGIGVGTTADKFYESIGVRREMYGYGGRIEKREELLTWMAFQAMTATFLTAMFGEKGMAIITSLVGGEDDDEIYTEGLGLDGRKEFFGESLDGKSGKWKEGLFISGRMYGDSGNNWRRTQAFTQATGIEPQTVYMNGKKVLSYKNNPVYTAMFGTSGVASDALLFNDKMDEIDQGFLYKVSVSQMLMTFESSPMKGVSDLFNLLSQRNDAINMSQDTFDKNIEKLIKTTSVQIRNILIPRILMTMEQDIEGAMSDQDRIDLSWYELATRDWPIVNNLFDREIKYDHFGKPLLRKTKTRSALLGVTAVDVANGEVYSPVLFDISNSGEVSSPFAESIRGGSSAKEYALFESKNSKSYLLPDSKTVEITGNGGDVQTIKMDKKKFNEFSNKFAVKFGEYVRNNYETLKNLPTEKEYDRLVMERKPVIEHFDQRIRIERSRIIGETLKEMFGAPNQDYFLFKLTNEE